jgi:hypothetical protein
MARERLTLDDTFGEVGAGILRAVAWTFRHWRWTLPAVAFAGLFVAAIATDGPATLAAATVFALVAGVAVIVIPRRQVAFAGEPVTALELYPGPSRVISPQYRPPVPTFAPPIDGLRALVVGETVAGPHPLLAHLPESEQTRKAKPWVIKVLGYHWLAVGVTGAGKSGFLRSLIDQVAPWVHHGVVKLVGFDAKCVELSLAQPMFSDLVIDTSTDKDPDDAFAKAATPHLRAVRRAMNSRLQAMAVTGDDIHIPTVEAPHIVVVIDEVGDLVETTPPAAGKANEAILRELCRKGRAAAVTVVLCTQDPRIKVLDIRRYIPGRVCFRVMEDTDPDMALGEGSRKRGALADYIPEESPGMAFVRVEGVRQPELVRAAWLPKEHVKQTAALYGRTS